MSDSAFNYIKKLTIFISISVMATAGINYNMKYNVCVLWDEYKLYTLIIFTHVNPVCTYTLSSVISSFIIVVHIALCICSILSISPLFSHHSHHLIARATRQTLCQFTVRNRKSTFFTVFMLIINVTIFHRLVYHPPPMFRRYLPWSLSK